MSAPMTHDPLVVNTKDGVVWQRRAVTADGRGLYAVVGSCSCPEFKMATLAELAEHGIAGSADVLPMPVGPQADPVAAGRALDLLALMDERAASKVSPVLAAVLDEAERLRARVAELDGLHKQAVLRGMRMSDRARVLQSRVAELEAERHSTNESLDNAVQELRDRRDDAPITDPEQLQRSLRAHLFGGGR